LLPLFFSKSLNYRCGAEIGPTLQKKKIKAHGAKELEESKERKRLKIEERQGVVKFTAIHIYPHQSISTHINPQ
jgi:hypothetical protein